MSPPDWNKIESLFEAALDRPEDERLDWLSSACDDPALHREVATLLRAAERSEDFLKSPAEEVASALIMDSHRTGSRENQVPSESATSGDRIGRYCITKRIGWGGNGAVYLGERADGEFSQRVALKLLREDRMSRTQQNRFLAERQILASLSHPGIARLLDGGVTDDGIPFIVMEYIDGSPIDEYCNAQRLTIRDRLALFQRVCSVVQHAHSQLIVHRDIKPSNVMVTTDGRVKLVDFGVAKLLDAEADGRDLPRPALNLTPEYASPEQVCGQPVTAVSDVYSLGVLLYQLLAGRRPYDVSGVRATQIVKTVCEVEPPPPSAQFDDVGETEGEDALFAVTTVAGQRSSHVDAVKRQLRGDVDSIVMKALRKHPARRYQSVESFADDIGCYLDSRPVGARNGTYAYRISKYVRRNRITVAFISVLALTLLGGLAASMWQASKRAEQATRAEQTTRFMTDMLAGFDPNSRPGKLEQVEEILDAGTQRLHKDLVNQPDLSSEIAAVLGDLYEDYGRYNKARELYELSLAKRRRSGSRDDAQTADVMAKLASVVNKMGDHEEARDLMMAALETGRATYGIRSERAADMLDGLAVVHLNLGGFDEARRLLLEALDIFRAKHGDDHVRVAGIRRHLAYVNQQQHRLVEADSLYRLAHESMARVLGPDHTEVAQTVHDHGSLLVRMGRLNEAETKLRLALQIRRDRLGNLHPQVAQSLSHLGLLMSRRDRFDEAEELLLEARELRRELFGEKHLTYAHSINQLGQLQHARGNQDAADELLREAIRLYRDLLGTRHIQTAAALQIWGRRLKDRGSYPEAEIVFREVLDIRTELLGDHTLQTTESMLRLASTLLQLDKAHEAVELLSKASRTRQELYGPDHERTLEVRLWHGIALTEVAQFEEAESILTDVLNVATDDDALLIDADLRSRTRQAMADLYLSWHSR
ncbi:MAG: serine/threonine protein kinase [Rhodothermales bacterium]|nr:serine/threonine protein kinase [Rhodothermales bacterium]